MQCDDVVVLIPELVDGAEVHNLAVERHIESCLRCQAELARYRRMLRGLRALRTFRLDPPPGSIERTLAALDDELERAGVRLILSGRRLAYAGAIGGTVAAVLVARTRRKALRLAG